MISTIDLKESGVLLRTLLTTVRHRGAFSAVYPAYVSLNTRLLDSVDSTTAEVPAQWLEDNLASITSNNISITRRSAGLPLCILAIVSSERSSKKKMLDKTMKRLLELANQEPPPDADQRIDMPQVHAYNIMRTIFMDAKLATAVLGYASDGFSLAISGFSSSRFAFFLHLLLNCEIRYFGTRKIINCCFFLYLFCFLAGLFVIVLSCCFQHYYSVHLVPKRLRMSIVL